MTQDYLIYLEILNDWQIGLEDRIGWAIHLVR